MNNEQTPPAGDFGSTAGLGLDAAEVTNAPSRVWLVVGDIDGRCEFTSLSDVDVSWCDAPQYDADVEYVRADLVRAAMPDNWQDDQATLALAEVLGLDVDRENAKAYGFET
jgi:hypothetical protein